MNDMFNPDKMAEAARLTRAGRLTEATALLQRMFRAEAAPDVTFGTAADIRPTRRRSPIIDAPSGSQQPDRAPARVVTTALPHLLRAVRGLVDRIKRSSGLGIEGLRQHAPAAIPDIVPKGGKFIAASYSNRAGSRAYKLYIPSRYSGQALPLVVMLHGCNQSSDDFAAGTRMNAVAEEASCLVVYPEQRSDANPAKCWNWFRPGDQRRDQGEPSLIAGITRQVMRDYAVDPQRVYIGGLSAGAAAAAVMGTTYPDLFAAVGVHSGLACGAATDLSSAFVAMQQGNLAASAGADDILAAAGEEPPLPTIVFHGDQDTTVHPRNGDHVIARQMGVARSKKQVHRGRAAGGHAFTRTIHADASGRQSLEQWEIHGSGHAWSGGSPAGSYTDPRGPDAAREMLRFFLAHPRPTGDL
jgi:poly(hydroxyalkanoate) depolymerase family esterase